MPGLFTPPSLHDGSRPRCDLFAPAPRFPTANETAGQRQVIDSDEHGAGRKRYRHNGGVDAPLVTSQSPTTPLWADSSLGYSRFSNARSPPPLANDRYELAGGMENPGRFTGQMDNNYDDYFQLEKQRGMWPTSPPSGLPKQPSADEMPTTLNGSKPWMLNQIMSIVGGVAGKLFEFCSVPFRGFQAGGGQAYSVDEQGEIAAKLGLQDKPLNGHMAEATPPRGDPEPNYGVISIESLENERPRMAKRLRTTENWVVVDKDGGMQSRPSTPRLSERRVPNNTRSPSQIPRPASRANASTPASKRPSLIPVSRRSTFDRKSLYGTPSANGAANPCTPVSRSHSRNSYGSPVMFDDMSNQTRSPLPAESQRLIHKMRREELEEEARMRRMSSQMSNMLREAREALGSKFDMGDENFDDM